MIKVVVHGALGRMGREVSSAVCRQSDMQLCGAVELKAVMDYLPLPDSTQVPLSTDISAIIKQCQPDVVVDFSIAQAVMPAVRIAAKQGVNLVIGTTGLTKDNLEEINQLAITHQICAVVAANFSLGAVMLMHLSKIAAKYFDNAEIIELHHDQKMDAPSGTALTTAKLMAESRGKPFVAPPGQHTVSRGELTEGISIHSVRLPGFLAHQEVIFGTLGQTLTLRHDSISRESFIPGVLLAIRAACKRKGLVNGLDTLLGLS